MSGVGLPNHDSRDMDWFLWLATPAALLVVIAVPLLVISKGPQPIRARVRTNRRPKREGFNRTLTD